MFFQCQFLVCSLKTSSPPPTQKVLTDPGRGTGRPPTFRCTRRRRGRKRYPGPSWCPPPTRLRIASHPPRKCLTGVRSSQACDFEVTAPTPQIPRYQTSKKSNQLTRHHLSSSRAPVPATDTQSNPLTRRSRTPNYRPKALPQATRSHRTFAVPLDKAVKVVGLALVDGARGWVHEPPGTYVRVHHLAVAVGCMRLVARCSAAGTGAAATPAVAPAVAPTVSAASPRVVIISARRPRLPTPIPGFSRPV